MATTKAKPKPKTLTQQALELVAAGFKPTQATAASQAQQAITQAKLQAQQALGFQTALANATASDPGAIKDAYTQAGAALAGFGNLALATGSGVQQGAAQEAQNYIGTVAPATSYKPDDFTGAMKALGTVGITDPASELALRAPAAYQHALATRAAQLGGLADFGTMQVFRGQQEADKIKAAAAAQIAAERPGAVLDALKYLHEDLRAEDENRRQNEALRIEKDRQRLAWAQEGLASAKTAAEQAQWAKEYALAQKKANADITYQQGRLANDRAKAAAKAKTGGRSQYQVDQLTKQANDTASSFYSPKPKTKQGIFGSEVVPGSDKPLNYQKALKRLQQKYPMFSTEHLVGILNAYYATPGKEGRPVFSYPERKALMQKGYTKAQITRAMNDYVRALKSGIGDSGTLYAEMAAALGA